MSTPLIPSRRVLTPKEASRKTRVSESTLAKWRMIGTGPTYLKIGHKIAYYDDVLDAWLAKCTRESTSQYAKSA